VNVKPPGGDGLYKEAHIGPSSVAFYRLSASVYTANPAMLAKIKIKSLST
jgi:hypothetical protein